MFLFDVCVGGASFYNPDCGSLCIVYYTVLWQRLSICYVSFCHCFCPPSMKALLLGWEGFIMIKGRNALRCCW